LYQYFLYPCENVFFTKIKNSNTENFFCA